MLKAESQHRRLPIVVSPRGTFYTPTSEEGYGEAEATADLLSGKNSYAFQHLWIREATFFWRSKWVADEELLQFNHFPKGWKLLEGRPYQMAEAITPETARELFSSLQENP